MTSEIVVGSAEGALMSKFELELPGGSVIVKCHAGSSMQDAQKALCAASMMFADQCLSKAADARMSSAALPSDTPLTSLNRCKLQIVAIVPASPAVAESGKTGGSQASCAELKSYKIRIRKFDQSVVMSGSLPADATLQSLADEIARLGHASAGAFSMLLPPYQDHPPTVHEPKNFCAASLESCGVFGSQMVVALQKVGISEVGATEGKGKQLNWTVGIDAAEFERRKLQIAEDLRKKDDAAKRILAVHEQEHRDRALEKQMIQDKIVADNARRLGAVRAEGAPTSITIGAPSVATTSIFRIGTSKGGVEVTCFDNDALMGAVRAILVSKGLCDQDDPIIHAMSQ
jgi:hypothetical protein